MAHQLWVLQYGELGRMSLFGLKFVEEALSHCINALRVGHFHIIQKWWTSKYSPVFVRFLVKEIGINSEKYVEYGKYQHSGQ